MHCYVVLIASQTVDYSLLFDLVNEAWPVQARLTVITEHLSQCSSQRLYLTIQALYHLLAPYTQSNIFHNIRNNVTVTCMHPRHRYCLLMSDASVDDCCYKRKHFIQCYVLFHFEHTLQYIPRKYSMPSVCHSFYPQVNTKSQQLHITSDRLQL